MKRILTLILSAAATLAFAAESVNLVKNADFKAFDAATGRPQAWGNIPALTGSRIEQAGTPGAYALQVAGEAEGKRALWLQQLPGVKPGVTYQVRANVLGTAGGVYQLYVERAKPEFKSFHSDTALVTGKEQLVTFEFSFPDAGGVPYVVFAVTGEKPAAFYNLVIIAKP